MQPRHRRALRWGGSGKYDSWFLVRAAVKRAVLHDEHGMGEVVDMRAGIAGKSGQVGMHACCDTSEVILLSQDPCRHIGSCVQRLRRGHAVTHHGYRLTPVGAMREYADIAAVADDDAELE